MGITLTEKAASEVKRIIADQKLEPETVLRVGVTGGGCSGFSYALGFDKQFDAKVDSRFEFHGVPVVVDPKGADFSRYRGATVITPNRAELAAANAVRLGDDVLQMNRIREAQRQYMIYNAAERIAGRRRSSMSAFASIAFPKTKRAR